MQAGRFRDEIIFQRLVEGDDGYGNPVTGWDEDHHRDWGDLLETTGRERLAAGRIEAPTSATLRVRASPETVDLTDADRVLARGRLWNIRGIAAMGRKGEALDMLLEGGVAT